MSSSSQSKKKRWIVGVMLLTIVLTGFGVNVVYRALYRTSEFPAFRRFTRLGVFENRDMYTEMEHARYYPPFFTIVFSVFSWSSVLVGAVLFYVTCCVLFLLSVATCVHGAWEGEGRPPDRLYVISALMGGGIFLDVMARCESDVLVLAPLCGAFYLLSRKKAFGAGLLVGLAAAIKLTPVCFGVYFLYKRELKAAAGALAGAALFVILIPSLVWGVDGNYRLHKSWWDYTISAHHKGGPRALVPDAYRSSNQSLTAAMVRYLTTPGASASTGGGERYVNLLSLREKTTETIVRVLQIAIILLLAFACRFKVNDRLSLGMEYSLVLIAMLELCAISWTSHHVILLIPYTVAAAYWLQRGGEEGGDENRNVSLVKKGTVVSLILMCLSVAPILKSLSALFFATMVMFTTFLIVLSLQNRDREPRRAQNET